MQFATLYKKELVATRAIGLAMIALVVGWNVFLATRGRWPEGMPTGLSFLPLMILPAATLALTARAFNVEFREKTSSLWLSIPMSGYSLLGAKALMVFTYVFSTSIVSLVCSYLFILRELPNSQILLSTYRQAIVTDTGVFAVIFVALGAVLIANTMLAGVVGRSIPRFHTILSGVSWFGGMWLLAKVTPWVAWTLSFLPDVRVYSIMTDPKGSQIRMEQFPLEFIAAILILAALYFIGASTLLRRTVDA